MAVLARDILAYLADFSLKNVQFPFYNTRYQTKNVRRYFIDKIIFFYLRNILNIGKSEPYFAILLFYDVNFTATVA